MNEYHPLYDYYRETIMTLLMRSEGFDRWDIIDIVNPMPLGSYDIIESEYVEEVDSPDHQPRYRVSQAGKELLK